jgi:predicted nucleic acid-binding protein
MSRYLLDTNVLVYCFAGNEPEKQARALDVIGHVGQPGAAGPSALLPAQALAEFARVATGRLDPPLPADEVYAQVELYEQVFPVVSLTPAVVLEAVRGLRYHGFSYYDAQIWAAAKLAQIPIVLSEDFASGSSVEGVLFVNPFAHTFKLADL